MAHLYTKCLPRNSLSAWAPGGSTSGVNHCVYLIEFQVDHNQCEWMGVYRASLRLHAKFLSAGSKEMTQFYGYRILLHEILLKISGPSAESKKSLNLFPWNGI